MQPNSGNAKVLLARFLLVGIANTLIGLCAIYFAMYVLQFEVIAANAFGYTIGVLLGFALNRAWTFDSRTHVVSSFLRYLLVLIVAYGANLVTVLFATYHFSLSPYISQTLGIIPYTVVGFLGSRYFVFGSCRWHGQ